MAKKNVTQAAAHVSNMMKGRRKSSKRKKGNAPARTSKRGNGKRIR